MKTYEEYKDSGVEWIGEIPAHWEVKKLKYLADNLDNLREPLNGETRSDKEGIYPYYGATGIVDYIDDYRVEGKFVLIGEDGAPFFIPNRDVAYIAEGKYWVNNHAHILATTERILPEVLMHQLNCVDYRHYISGSTRDKLTKTELSNIELLLIPIEEQEAMTQYLNVKLVEIDNLIDAKRRLLQKLNAQRTAIINEAVTKGLDSNVPMKYSGIEWLDEIPVHWDVKKLKYLVNKIGSGVTPKGGGEVYQDSGIPFFRSQNIYNDGLRLDDVAYISPEIHEDMSGSKVQPGDVLLNITGASIGRCYYYDGSLGESNVNQHVCIIRPETSLIQTKYLHALFCAEIGREQIELQQTGANREGLTNGQLSEFYFPLPPVEEQSAISKHVDDRTRQIDILRQKLQTQIDKLRAYRQSLITEVVTGKRCVLESTAEVA